MYFTLADRPQTYGLPHVVDYRKDYSAGKPSTESIGKMQIIVLKSPIVWVLGLSSALMYVTRYAIHSWGPLYLQEMKNYSVVEAGFLIGANTIVGLAGAFKGIIGLFSYMGAATQDWISGYLISSGKTVVEGEAIYNFDKAFYFWIGASILSFILALMVWNVKPRE